MDILLNPHEVRVLGALIEKSLATPDAYPLSLSALVAACNQKSNREPVMNLSEGQVRDALDALVAQHLVRERSQAGARVSKYSHRLDDQLGLTFGFRQRELAVLSVLMLRGPQTPGELRTRTARLCSFATTSEVDETLLELATAERGPYTVELARRPGQREARHVQLFGGPVADEIAQVTVQDPYGRDARVAPEADPSAAPDALAERVSALEALVDRLEREVTALKSGEDETGTS